jgi:hypothetical protein
MLATAAREAGEEEGGLGDLLRELGSECEGQKGIVGGGTAKQRPDVDFPGQQRRVWGMVGIELEPDLFFHLH